MARLVPSDMKEGFCGSTWYLLPVRVHCDPIVGSLCPDMGPVWANRGPMGCYRALRPKKRASVAWHEVLVGHQGDLLLQ